MKMQRIRWVDDLRGVAIVLMVVFHFCYDLRYFGYVSWDVPNGSYWWPFRYLILTLFIFTMGVSLSLAHGNGIRWRKFGTRLGQLVLSAGLITLMSLYMFPDTWIYFGILHYLALASVVSLLFVPVPLVAFGAGLVIFVFYGAGVIDKQWPFVYSEALTIYTEDFVPIFPWLAVTLLGISVGAVATKIRLGSYLFWLPGWIRFAGRHGLIIYLVHQPIMFGGFYLVSSLL
jgi:uncharacterized membrane protein